jgi:hypothetical protein
MRMATMDEKGFWDFCAVDSDTRAWVLRNWLRSLVSLFVKNLPSDQLDYGIFFYKFSRLAIAPNSF